MLPRVDSCDIWHIGNSVLKRGKSATPPLLNSPGVLTSPSERAKLFA